MTEIPDWATNVPPDAGVHNAPARSTQWEGLSDNQMRQLRRQLLESIMSVVTQAITGLFVPGPFGSAFDQLKNWSDTLGEQIQIGVEQMVQEFYDLTGVDLSVFLPLFAPLDMSSPEAFLKGWAEALIQVGTDLLSASSPLNALNLFNLIPTDLMGQISHSALGQTITNLIADPLFQVQEAFNGLEQWFHDATTGRVGLGSAKTTADGTLKELLGNLIPVSAGQVLDLSGYSKWSNLAGTGNPIALAVTGYDAGGSAISQANVAVHNTIPATTDWVRLAGTYTVPDLVTNIRTRLVVTATATAGTVWWDDLSATKTQTVFQKLIAGTDPGQILTDDIRNLFTGIITNATSLLTKLEQSAHDSLVATIGGSFGTNLAAAEDRLNDFLHSLSTLNASNIGTGTVDNQFVPGVGDLHDAIVTAVGNLGGTGFDIAKAIETLEGQTHAIVDHGAGLNTLFTRLSGLESKVANLPVSSGGTGAGTADGGLLGVSDVDLLERVNSVDLGLLWNLTYRGGSTSGRWNTTNGHDAQWVPAGTVTREFLAIRNNPAIPKTQTDYQRVSMELSSKATRFYDALLGTYNYCGGGDLWLRVSDASTDLTNVTGIRIRYNGDGGLYIHEFRTGTATQIYPLSGSPRITPPGPGANLIGLGGVLADGAPMAIQAIIGNSIRATATTTLAPGSTSRRWGHGGIAEGHLLPFPGQESPGGIHFVSGMDQTR